MSLFLTEYSTIFLFFYLFISLLCKKSYHQIRFLRIKISGDNDLENKCFQTAYNSHLILFFLLAGMQNCTLFDNRIDILEGRDYKCKVMSVIFSFSFFFL